MARAGREVVAVGLSSVGSFTTSFTRAFGKTPTAYRDSFPPAATYAHVPACVLRVCSRPGPASRVERPKPPAEELPKTAPGKKTVTPVRA
ncbi:putative AraC family transcriptional regulator [Gordonia alkanivorans NBRC 16433]|jgi:hypothetical protein|uniref:HTH araC/xylS-type domain-containing protein n=2 Tax=Gordonia alkanivorans TaxID=84096 RepID=W9DK24_9ACTN|nr:hypothetical protein V525_10375 [Gordonia alkanivorans CGMCC 6845]GAA12942.1 putative AraC family transcriptional regulator [Gordonia alkanivorans NBRC 16433]